MQQDAETVKELLEKVKTLAEDMQIQCDNSVHEIIITLDEEDGRFLVYSD